MRSAWFVGGVSLLLFSTGCCCGSCGNGWGGGSWGGAPATAYSQASATPQYGVPGSNGFVASAQTPPTTGGVVPAMATVPVEQRSRVATADASTSLSASDDSAQRDY